MIKNNVIFLIINLMGLVFGIDFIVRILNGNVGFGFQWLGLIIVLLYSLWVRYYLREKIGSKFNFFKNGISRPYALAAMLFLFFAMITDVFDHEKMANGFAIIVYYFLIETIIIELAGLKKVKNQK